MERLGGIRVPTLVVAGSADQLTPPKYGAYLRNRIPGAQMALIPGAGHMMALENPDALLKHLAPFLNEHAPPA
jgi:pimeloyl-ACP methyl ester carboxylesterase